VALLCRLDEELAALRASSSAAAAAAAARIASLEKSAAGLQRQLDAMSAGASSEQAAAAAEQTRLRGALAAEEKAVAELRAAVAAAKVGVEEERTSRVQPSCALASRPLRLGDLQFTTPSAHSLVGLLAGVLPALYLRRKPGFLRPLVRCCQAESEGLSQQLAKTCIDGDAVAGQLRSRIAALEEDLKRAVSLGRSDAADAEARVRLRGRRAGRAAHAAREAEAAGVGGEGAGWACCMGSVRAGVAVSCRRRHGSRTSGAWRKKRRRRARRPRRRPGSTPRRWRRRGARRPPGWRARRAAVAPPWTTCASGEGRGGRVGGLWGGLP
jgi:hypothetical protein